MYKKFASVSAGDRLCQAAAIICLKSCWELYGRFFKFRPVLDYRRFGNFAGGILKFRKLRQDYGGESDSLDWLDVNLMKSSVDYYRKNRFDLRLSR